MKKYILFLTSFSLLLSCSNKTSITKEECLEKINNTKNIYNKYENLSKDFIYYKNITNGKNELIQSIQFAYDSENKLFYEFNLEENTKTWSYFETNILYRLIQTKDEKIKVKTTEDKLFGEDYFKKVFSDTILIEVNNAESDIKNTSTKKEQYYSSPNNAYSINLDFTEVKNNYEFKDNLLMTSQSIEYNEDKSVFYKIEIKVVYEKFTTSVNKEEFK